MRERIRAKRKGLYISMPGLVTSSFLEQIAKAQPLPERQYDLPTKRVTANGAEFNYFEFGEGEPVVFVHGSIGDYRTWGYQFEPFAANYKVISYSRRYHYPNAWAGDGLDYSTGLHASDCAAFIKALGLGPAHIIGQSSGASIAAQCASAYPEVTRTLVVDEPDWMHWLIELGGQAFVDEWIATVDQKAAQALAAGDEEETIRIYVDGVLGAGSYAKLSPEMRQVMSDNVPELRAELKCGEIFFSPFSFDDARRIKAPTLLIEGSASLPMFRPIAKKFLECVPNIERGLVDGAPHAAHFVTPDRFNEVVLDFLARQQRSKRSAVKA
jgi:pimeloyl-ACP methyl ester carboxylesterase